MFLFFNYMENYLRAFKYCDLINDDISPHVCEPDELKSQVSSAL